MKQTASAMLLSTTPETELRLRLQNVFRVLGIQNDKRRAQALDLRCQISSIWQDRAARGLFIRCPPAYAYRAREAEEIPTGMLSYLGYRVGETEPTAADSRRHVLEFILQCHLPPLNSFEYFSQWGEPRTTKRFNKLTGTMASLTRSATLRDQISCGKAINDWQRDLAFVDGYAPGTLVEAAGHPEL